MQPVGVRVTIREGDELLLQTLIGMARVCERFLSPVRKLVATRILIIWEHADEG